MRTTTSTEHRRALRVRRLLHAKLKRAIANKRHSVVLAVRAEISALEATIADHEAEYRERLDRAKALWMAKRGNLASLKGIDPAKRDAARLRQRRKQENLGKSEQAPLTPTRSMVNWCGTPEADCWPADASCRDPLCTDWKHSAGPGCAESGKYAHPTRRRR